MNTTPHKTLTASALLMALALPLASHAADRPITAPMGNHSGDSDRVNLKTSGVDRDALQAALRQGQSVAAIQARLASLGWTITATNEAETDYLEYEVVKGNTSAEIQIDMDKATKVPHKIDVTANLWRADSTKAAMRGQTFTMVSSGDYSDRKYMLAWSSEKEMLEEALGKGQTPTDYRQKLADLGYQVTSTNDRDKDYVEFEIVKGRNSYEVQLELNASTGRADDVDVTTNVWESDATSRALAGAKR